MNGGDIKQFVTQRLTKYSVGFWFWVVMACCLLFIVSVLLVKIFFPGQPLIRQAIDMGQRVTLHIASTEVDGNARHTRREEASTAAGASPTVVLGKDGLAPAPLAAISEQSDKGMIPMVGHEGSIPWKYYARPYNPKEKRPVVAIILTDLGLSKPLTENVFALPHAITLSFSPYASDAKTWAKKAREEGFESFIDIPLEPEDYPLSDPGPYGLLDNLETNDITARLHWLLSRFPGFTGMLAPNSEKMTANSDVMMPVLTELTARGVLFIYKKTPQNTVLTELSKSRGLYTLGIDKVLDDEISQPAIEKQLDDLTALAKTQGYAIGIAHSYPPSIDALTNWTDTLSSQGVDLVPVSAIGLKVFP